jgi:predicted transcriptional regulator
VFDILNVIITERGKSLYYHNKLIDDDGVIIRRIYEKANLSSFLIHHYLPLLIGNGLVEMGEYQNKRQGNSSRTGRKNKTICTYKITGKGTKYLELYRNTESLFLEEEEQDV